MAKQTVKLSPPVVEPGHTAHGSRPTLRIGFARLVLALSGVIGVSPCLAQLPSGAVTRFGEANVSTVNDKTLRITQSTPRTIIDWSSFSIGAGHRVQFIQPDANAIALNRVTGPLSSVIDGQMGGNGQVWLSNPHGIFVGPTGRIDVHALLLTTLAVPDSAFLSQAILIERSAQSSSETSLLNRGEIVTGSGGYAVLAGESIRNEGWIVSEHGRIALLAGREITLDLTGDGLLSARITQPLQGRPEGASPAVVNTGLLYAPGGSIELSARATADGILRDLVHAGGHIEATRARSIDGEIVLDAGGTHGVRIDGTVVAGEWTHPGMGEGPRSSNPHGSSASSTSGSVSVTAERLTLGASSMVFGQLRPASPLKLMAEGSDQLPATISDHPLSIESEADLTVGRVDARDRLQLSAAGSIGLLEPVAIKGDEALFTATAGSGISIAAPLVIGGSGGRAVLIAGANAPESPLHGVAFLPGGSLTLAVGGRFTVLQTTPDTAALELGVAGADLGLRLKTYGASSGLIDWANGGDAPGVRHYLYRQTPAPLEISDLVAYKVYDGSDDARAAIRSGRITGLPEEESVTGASVQFESARFSSKYVGTGLGIEFGGLSLHRPGWQVSGFGYRISGPPKAEIAAHPLEVTGLGTVNRDADGTLVVALSGNPLVRGVEGDDVFLSGAAVGRLAQADPGTGLSVTIEGLSLGGRDAAQYLLKLPDNLKVDIAQASPPPPEPVAPVAPITPTVPDAPPPEPVAPVAPVGPTVPVAPPQTVVAESRAAAASVVASLSSPATPAAPQAGPESPAQGPGDSGGGDNSSPAQSSDTPSSPGASSAGAAPAGAPGGSTSASGSPGSQPGTGRAGSAAKPPTPRDAADAGDRTLARVTPPAPRRPAPQATRLPSMPTVITPLVSAAPPSAPPPPARTVFERELPGLGNSSRW
jgi:filamentous hemagglutinin family protein